MPSLCYQLYTSMAVVSYEQVIDSVTETLGILPDAELHRVFAQILERRYALHHHAEPGPIFSTQLANTITLLAGLSDTELLDRLTFVYRSRREHSQRPRQYSVSSLLRSLPGWTLLTLLLQTADTHLSTGAVRSFTQCLHHLQLHCSTVSVSSLGRLVTAL